MSHQNHRKDSSPAPDLVTRPQVSLLGEVNEAMVSTLLEQLSGIDDGDRPVVIELTTLGGDAEMARRMVLEIDIARQRLAPRRLVFLGKTTVYSAGITVMSAFAREDRYLAQDAVLLIHVRQLEKTLQVDGPMRESLSQVEALVHQMKTGMKLEEGNFARLLKGSTLQLDDVLQRALYNWYISADEAAELGLVAGVLKTGGA
ncbi:ATP-dependent Clp protease proteolytic subunit [Novosphingobium sp.]|jgi:ATP-dependent protease ClpP protease subunit|uniref:ATP-dependent Clp protease proteolytic subunit n=1 Tax=Novosphingobium sp. TaxID=1874826 RepID=UPI00322FAB9A